MWVPPSVTVVPSAPRVCRSAGKEVHAWTVDDLPAMHRMLEAGVDAIVTGQPKRLQQAIRQHQRACREEPRQQGQQRE